MREYDGDQHRHQAVKQPGRRPGMAVIVIQEFEATTDQYDQVNEKLGGVVPNGLIAHAGAQSGDGKIKVVDIWESEEKWESFLNGRLGAAIVEVIGPPPEGAQPPPRSRSSRRVT
jgi:hypothetical protein